MTDPYEHQEYIVRTLSFRTAHQGRKELSDLELQRSAPSIFAHQPMEGVSGRYAFVATSQIVSRMKETGWVPVEAVEQRVLLKEKRGFQRHMIRFQQRKQIFTPGEYTAEICLVNSHDRSSAFQVHAGLYRLVCANGMMIADSTFDQVRIRHTGVVAEIVEASLRISESIPLIIDQVESFKARTLAPEEALAFAERALLLRYDNLEEAPVRREVLLRPRRDADRGDDLWRVLSRVQENLIRGRVRDYGHLRADGKPHHRMRGVASLVENLRINKGLWELAEQVRQKAFAI